MRNKCIVSFVIFALLFFQIIEFASAADPGHDASAVGPGTFEAGNFLFQNNLTVGGNNFFVNNGTGYVGIGTLSPLSKLSVVGITYAANQEGGIRLQSAGDEHYGQINIATDAGGTPRLAIHPPAYGGSSETFTILNNGYIGIGTSTPSRTLDVRGVGNFSGTIYINNNTDISTFSSGGGGGWATTASYVYNDTASVKVGIGIATPVAKLDVNGSFAALSYGSGGGSYSIGANSYLLGYVQNGSLTSSGNGSFAQGVSNASSIFALSWGSFAQGYANVNSNLTSSNYGSFAQGYAYSNGNLTSSNYGSFAQGYARSGNITASGSGAIAMGYNLESSIIASGTGSIAQGAGATAGKMISSASGSFAQGYANTGTIAATGSGSFAQGYSNAGMINASNSGSVAQGYVYTSGTLTSSGSGSIAQGYAYTSAVINASNSGSIAQGYASASSRKITASGAGAFASGYAGASGSLDASGSGAIAMGYARTGNIVASGGGSFAWGDNIQTSGNLSFVIGSTFTNNINNSFLVGFSSTPMLFVNGSAVGIGTSTPGYTLDVNGVVNASGYLVNGTPLTSGSGGGGWATTASYVYNDTASVNVGIGTATPQTYFHIVGGAGNTILLQKTTNNLPAITFIGTPYNATIEGGDTLNFYTNGTSRMFINDTGNVGIGTSTPGYKLDVTTGAAGTQAKFGANNNLMLNAFGTLQAYLSSTAEVSNGGVWTARGTSAAIIGYGDEAGGITFFGNTGLTSGNTFSPTERMRITGSGNVGIGTSSPIDTVTINISDSSLAKNVTFLLASGQNFSIKNNGAGGSARLEGTQNIILRVNGPGTATYFTNASGDTVSLISNSPSSNSYFNIGGGNVGIGTTAPTQTLNVVGTANVTGATYLGNSKCASGYVLTTDTNNGLVSCVADQTGSTLSGGATNNITKWTGTNTLGNSVIYESSGNIGIGATPGSYKLDVQGGNIRLGNSGETTYLGGTTYSLSGTSSGSSLYALQLNRGGGGANPDLWGGSGGLTLGGTSGDTSQLVLKSGGNVGIGTPSPTGVLQINNYGEPAITGTDPTGAFVIKTTASTALTVGVSNSDPFEGWVQMRHGTLSGYTYPLSLQPLGGYVGIGTTSPGAKLHVTASTPSGIGSIPSGTSAIIDSNSNNYLTFRNDADDGTYSGLLFQDNNVGGYVAYGNANAGYSDYLLLGGYTGISFQVGSSETVGGKTAIMSVTSSGATISGNTVWHAGNDGPSSGLDADTVDTYHMNQNVLTSSSPSFAGLASTSGLSVSNNGGTWSYIYMYDDESAGTKSIHANSNVMGFLNGSGNWMSYWDTNGNQQNYGSVTATSFSGAGTGLTGTASSLTVGTASNANALGGLGLTASGDRWGVIANVGTDGVTETGKYFDFHESDGDTSDYAARITSTSGALSTTGSFSATDIISSSLYRRSAAGAGYLSGNYNSVETTGTTGAIYSIGGSYYPTAGSLNTMYGIGYTHVGQGQMPSGASGWGMYVAANGVANVWLGGDTGNIIATGDLYVGGTVIEGDSKTMLRYSDSYLRFNEDNDFGSGIWMGASNLLGSTGYLAMGSNGGTTDSRVYINGGTHNGVNVIKLDGSNGHISAYAYWYLSDARFKTNVTSLNDTTALAKILQLRPVTFNWINSTAGNNGTQIGLIAQDVEKIFPEVVNTANETGLKSIEYGNLIAPVISAMQEQQKQISELQNKTLALQKQVDELKAMVNKSGK
jgi:hypothetical protein